MARGQDILDNSVHTPAGDAPVIPVALIVAGAYLCWFAVHYWASDTAWPSDPVKAVLTGKGLPKPDRSALPKALASQAAGVVAAGAANNQQGTPGGAVGMGPGQVASLVGGNAASIDALHYVGQGYVFGGPADQPGNWDCSSFVSYVLGHDLGMKLPGGGLYGAAGYPPHTHGPTTLDYQLYGAAISRTQAQAGDLIVSSEHMGICTSGTQYVSARTPALGVGVDNIDDPFPGGTPVFRRI